MSDELFSALADAMNAPDLPAIAPLIFPTTLGKRTRKQTEVTGELDDEENAPDPEPDVTTSQSTTANQNVVAYTRSIARRRKLQDEYASELQDFAQDITAGREIRMYAAVLAVLQSNGGGDARKMGWTPTRDFEKNVKGTVFHVLLAGDIPHYKGTEPVDTAMKMIMKHRFDLPQGIEDNHAHMATIFTLAGNALTQLRAKLKKLLVRSVKPDDPAKRWNIVTLGEKVVRKSNLKLCGPVFGRLALMRAVYATGTNTGAKYWDALDVFLQKIRTAAKHDDAAVQKAFASLMDTDRASYGVASSYVLDDFAAHDLNANNSNFQYSADSEDDDGGDA
ncbi:hypothetical protein BC629DRAFT_1496916 [Irpex lacteus]|nr:hypothetical protein BC629DRAFT_1496916 [Irpex lacteus]